MTDDGTPVPTDDDMEDAPLCEVCKRIYDNGKDGNPYEWSDLVDEETDGDFEMWRCKGCGRIVNIWKHRRA